MGLSALQRRRRSTSGAEHEPRVLGIVFEKGTRSHGAVEAVLAELAQSAVVTLVRNEAELQDSLSARHCDMILLAGRSRRPDACDILARLCVACPHSTVLVIGGGPEVAAGLPKEAMPRVRVLPDELPIGNLTGIVHDYLDRQRLLAVERQLATRLSDTEARLDELVRYLNEETISSTESVLRLHHVVAGLSGMSSKHEITTLVVSTAAGMMRSRRVSLLMPDAACRCLTVEASVGVEPELVDDLRIPVGAPICGELFASGRAMLIRRAKDLPRSWHDAVDTALLTEPPFISMVLSGPDRPIGILNVSVPVHAQAYTEEALTGLHAVVEVASIAIANQIRGEERNEARDRVMLALAKLAESRDPETGKHLERVQNYCRLLAEYLAEKPAFKAIITPDYIRRLVRSSPLHDIGKVGVPDEVLLKPGKLTDEEFELMKRHPVIGGDTIKSLIGSDGQQDFLQMAMEIAYHHHEKYDGSGYPSGLAGEAIPLPARILALADVYDALTTARVYKAPMSHDKAREIVVAGKGEHFDPQIVEAFLARETEFEKLGLKLADTVRCLPHMLHGEPA